MVNKTWVAMFSRTGSELKSICKSLKREPDLILTNNKDYDKSLFKHVIYNTPDQIYSVLLKDKKFLKNSIITLHGYMRIVPPEVCNTYTILNGHPGDILTYPDLLKGKDPQKKAIELKHSTARTVIHRVTPEVDDGLVIAYSDFVPITSKTTEESLTNELREKSIELWVQTLDKLL